MWTYIWLALFVVSAIIEFTTFEMVSIWVTVGSLVGIILSLCNVNPIVQVVVVVIVTLITLLSFRKVMLKFLSKKNVETNINAVIGQKLKLLTAIKVDEHGSAKYNGVVWTVASEDNQPINAEEYVVVVSVSGNKLIVKKENENV